ncbi:proline dehydrogenase 1, mitochondrial-like isoform X2 [Amphibalanus amphitrite]|uniref:proline dehydrogenase 1, mitochondrial-like isoform X2 n=1 Tax=Amphibalanus amphitrite TaxID=1232801 RepID=UPI001C9005DA|nr:proline dehydrogenase 1, mitochondrial-like isoform X2 [Amphibalanus amphitrite]
MAAHVLRGSRVVQQLVRQRRAAAVAGGGGGGGVPAPAAALAGRAKSTQATELTAEAAKLGPQRDQLDLTFTDTRAAFQSKTTWEVFRGVLVYTLCTSRYLVEHNATLMKLFRKLLGQKLFHTVMRATFYGQFVAGADQASIRPQIENMRSFGVKSILDYSVEEDISTEEAEQAEMRSCSTPGEQEQELTVQKDPMARYHAHREFADRRVKVQSARTYFYMNEAQCEKNMETFLKSIEAVSGSTQCTGLAAIKMTALGRPQLLLSEVIMRTRRYLAELAGSERATDVISQDVSVEQIQSRLKETSGPGVEQWLKGLTYDQDGLIHLFSWSGLIDTKTLMSDLFRVPNLTTGRMEPLITSLTKDEEEMFKNMMRRLHTIFSYARECDVRVMVDAEQTYFQPAISRLTMELMRKYNREKAIVFNTYQCYLKEAYHNLSVDLDQADRQHFYFGAKLVRGAYMEQERYRAASLGYEDPINPTFEATSEMYERCLLETLRRIQHYKKYGQPRKLAIMVASHNEDTVRFTVQKMDELDIKREDKVVCFGQLLGMCDHVSFPLGQAGYSVYKYVPYGPIDEVLPYLSRRAQENKGILTKVAKERKMLRSELLRRLVSGQLFYKPVGNYTPV